MVKSEARNPQSEGNPKSDDRRGGGATKVFGVRASASFQFDLSRLHTSRIQFERKTDRKTEDRKIRESAIFLSSFGRPEFWLRQGKISIAGSRVSPGLLRHKTVWFFRVLSVLEPLDFPCN
jgi:hypothetical protein